MSAFTPPVVLTANLTADGAPVYLTAAQAWSRDLAEALVIESEAEHDKRLAFARGDEATVCDPYVFKVSVDGTTIDPITTRERIRSTGPTIRVRRPD